MAVIDHPAVDVSRPGWYPDPEGRHNLRYYDGGQWTEHVTHYGPTPCTGCSYEGSDIPTV